ncbi:MAG: ATP-dependent DNA ligase [candidate division Zixibacteria bacterium]|nr:ATP-dependent DNA ligase [candidate division Zixibacteria bacterium]
MAYIKAGNRKLEISNEDKVFFPESGITKGDLIDYYKQAGEMIIPHIKDRPLTMRRFPDGIEGNSFYQKNAPKNIPDWIKTEAVDNREGGKTNHIICNDVATLIFITNYGNITPHIWLSKLENLEKPDKIIFDLDPPGYDFDDVQFAAKLIYELLTEELDLPAFLMLTGSKGVHVVLPIKPENKFDEVRGFASNLADFMAQNHPERLTTEVRKNKRKGRLFLDIARNAYAQTGVAPYSVRAIENAPVAAPVNYDELSNKNMNAQKFNIKNTFKRMGQIDDPWKEINRRRFSLGKAREKFEKLKA